MSHQSHHHSNSSNNNSHHSAAAADPAPLSSSNLLSSSSGPGPGPVRVESRTASVRSSASAASAASQTHHGGGSSRAAWTGRTPLPLHRNYANTIAAAAAGSTAGSSIASTPGAQQLAAMSATVAAMGYGYESPRSVSGASVRSTASSHHSIARLSQGSEYWNLNRDLLRTKMLVASGSYPRPEGLGTPPPALTCVTEFSPLLAEQAVLDSTVPFYGGTGGSGGAQDQLLLTPSLLADEIALLEAPGLLKSDFKDALLNSLNTLAGVGLLSLPYAIKLSGWSGLVAIPIIGLVCAYTGRLLGQLMSTFSQLRGYTDIGTLTLGLKGHVALCIVFFLEIYLFLVSTIILMASCMETLVPSWSTTTWMWICTLAVYPTALCRNLSKLAWMSLFGLVGTVILVGVTIYFASVNAHQLWPTGATYSDLVKYISQTNTPWIEWDTWPISIGLIMACFAGHSLFPAIYADLEVPAQYGPIVNLSFGMVTPSYLGFALLGFLMFPSNIQEIITLNFPPSSLLSAFIELTIAIIAYTKFGLSFNGIAFPIEDVLEARFPVPTTPTGEWVMPILRFLLRSGLTVSCLLTALVIPHFADVMALSGALLSIFVSVTFPCLCVVMLRQTWAFHRAPWEVLPENYDEGVETSKRSAAARWWSRLRQWVKTVEVILCIVIAVVSVALAVLSTVVTFIRIEKNRHGGGGGSRHTL